MENCAAPAWSEVQLDTICKSISDGDHQAPPRAENGIPFLVISNVTSGRIDFKNVSRWVPMDYYERLKDIRKPEKNDLLYTVTGSFGIPAIVDTDQPFCFQRHIAIIKPNHATVSVDFLALYLRSPQAFHHSESVATGTAQKTVSLKNLRSFPISLPSMEEQAEIVRRVKQLFAHADRVEQQVNGALVRVNNLTQSILAKAFRGELTEQWRKHNPKLISGNNSAEALLERIEAERDQKNKQPRKRRASKEEKVVKKMDKKIGVVEALKRIGEPLSGQQLLVAAGYSADSSTEDLELFFLDLRDALTVQQRVVKLYRDRDGQDWFALPEMNKQMSREDR